MAQQVHEYSLNTADIARPRYRTYVLNRPHLARGKILQISSLQGLGSFPVALVIFAGIAVFLILRLRSVLGRRVGFEKPPIPTGQMPGFGGGPIIEGQAMPVQGGRPVPDPRSALGERLMQIVNLDPNFDPPKFLAGAETAFRTIVTGFAAGDRPTLKTLLSENVYQTFANAIAAREAANERHRTEIKDIRSAVIEDAQLIGDQAAVIVRFISDQVNVTLDAAGNPVVGNTGVTEILDLWTFERRLKSQDPTWRLAAARSG
jgi:predicted lipid-binding transport protein (Tim44 family)